MLCVLFTSVPFIVIVSGTMWCVQCACCTWYSSWGCSLPAFTLYPSLLCGVIRRALSEEADVEGVTSRALLYKRESLFCLLLFLSCPTPLLFHIANEVAYIRSVDIPYSSKYWAEF